MEQSLPSQSSNARGKRRADEETHTGRHRPFETVSGYADFSHPGSHPGSQSSQYTVSGTLQPGPASYDQQFWDDGLGFQPMPYDDQDPFMYGYDPNAWAPQSQPHSQANTSANNSGTQGSVLRNYRDYNPLEHPNAPLVSLPGDTEPTRRLVHVRDLEEVSRIAAITRGIVMKEEAEEAKRPASQRGQRNSKAKGSTLIKQEGPNEEIPLTMIPTSNPYQGSQVSEYTRAVNSRIAPRPYLPCGCAPGYCFHQV